MASDEERRELVRGSLLNALAELPRSVGSIVADVEEESRLRANLLGFAAEAYATHGSRIDERIDRGTFLRSEVLREWQDFVGANRVARVVSDGVGKVAATIRSVFRPGPAPPAPEVREAAFSDLIALITLEADRAASETAGFWARNPFGTDALARQPHLWGASTNLTAELHLRLGAWGTQVTRQIMEVGEKRRGLAKAASLGVNVVGTGAILAVFAQTGGITGARGRHRCGYRRGQPDPPRGNIRRSQRCALRRQGKRCPRRDHRQRSRRRGGTIRSGPRALSRVGAPGRSSS